MAIYLGNDLRGIRPKPSVENVLMLKNNEFKARTVARYIKYISIDKIIMVPDISLFDEFRSLHFPFKTSPFKHISFNMFNLVSDTL